MFSSAIFTIGFPNQKSQGPGVMKGGASSGGPIVKVIVTQSNTIAPNSKINVNRLFFNSFIIFHLPPIGDTFSIQPTVFFV